MTSTAIVFAHPGNTASDGCHYCRTNCDKWNVPWNLRHCHVSTSVKPSSSVISTSPPSVHTNSDDNVVISSIAIIGGIGFLVYLCRKEKK